MNLRLKSPIYVQLEITKSCNNFCDYCYNFWRKDPLERIRVEAYPLSHYIQIISKLIEEDVFQLTLTGGEPLLRKDLLPKIIEHASSGGLDVSLNTNLSLMDKETLLSLKGAGLKSILGSLISWDRATHNKIANNPCSYDSTLRGIGYVVSEGVSLGINMVVEKRNLEHILETARMLSKIGVSHFFATKLNPSPEKDSQQALTLNPDETRRALDYLLIARKELKIKVDVLEPLPHCFIRNPEHLTLLDRTCTAGVTWVSISPEGDVRACTHLSESYGNILREDLAVIWDRMQEWKDEKFVPIECRDECVEYPFCGGGCRSGALTQGNIYGRDPLMTSPLKEQINRREEKTTINRDEPLRLNKKTRYRLEPFGMTLYINPKRVAFVNQDAVKVIRYLAGKEQFTLDSLEEELSLTEYLDSFCQHMIQKGIISRVKNN